MDAFKDWGKFLQLAIPGLIMTCAEFWAFEIQTLFAGYFGTEYLSAQVRQGPARPGRAARKL
jgi:MATE family multidrug resistance protein